MHSGTEGATNEVEPLEEVTIVMPAEGTCMYVYNVHVSVAKINYDQLVYKVRYGRGWGKGSVVL